LLTDVNFDILEKLTSFATQRGHTMAELAIAWLVSHPWVSTVIAGVTKPAQITANIAAADWRLSVAEMNEIDLITGYKTYTEPRPRTYTLPGNYTSHR
jgi:aryl-alcohol dehydrogenase-like predicted oxidoreductase